MDVYVTLEIDEATNMVGLITVLVFIYVKTWQ